MKYRLPDLLCITSLLIALGGSALLSRSTHRRDFATVLGGDGSGVFFSTGRGAVGFGTIEKSPNFPGRPDWKPGLSIGSADWGVPRTAMISRPHGSDSAATRSVLAGMNYWLYPSHGSFGFGWDFEMRWPGYYGYTVSDFFSRRFVIPLWSIVLLFAIPPALRIVLMIDNRRRRTTGRCITCGYDLRASPKRCPECGKPNPAFAGSR